MSQVADTGVKCQGRGCMDIAEVYRSTRQGICSAWKLFTAMGSLRFPDAAQERRFVKHAGEHGLSVMRSAPFLKSPCGHRNRSFCAALLVRML